MLSPLSSAKILIVAMIHPYGDRSKGQSYEYYNFYLPLSRLAGEVITFDFMEQLLESGQEAMNHQLIDLVKSGRPDLTIIFPYTDQIFPETIDALNKYTVTLGYLYDTNWRKNYSLHWARHSDYVTTSDVNGVSWFRDHDQHNVFYSPFGCNHEFFKKIDLPRKYDISFIGGYNPLRAWYLNRLAKSGMPVKVHGPGWHEGSVTYEQMVEIFNQSRINLNLSNSISWDLIYILASLRNLKAAPRMTKYNLSSLFKRDAKTGEQLKGRHFEINSCGSFQLSYYVEGLERLYAIGEEIAIFSSPEDLVEKARYYLKHEDEREAIAKAGHRRTLAHHTIDARLTELYQNITKA